MSTLREVVMAGTVRLQASSARERGSVLGALNAELEECRRHLRHYGREISRLEPNLEQLDRPQIRVARRIQQLREPIAIEEEGTSSRC